MAMREVKAKQAEPRRQGWADVLDRAIYSVAPTWGARRMARRKQWEAAEQAESRLAQRRAERAVENSGRRYQGTEHNRFGGNWLASQLSADSALESDLDDARARSRDLYANDGFVAGAVETTVTNVVGTGLRPQARIKSAKGIVTDKQAEWLNRRLEEIYWRQAERLDTTGTLNDVAVQKQAVRNWLVDGEAFLVLRDIGLADKPLPLAVEIVDADRVQTPPEQAGNPLVRMGIEKNKSGQVVAYWVRTTHPHDDREVEFKFERVPADRMIHVFESLWSGQRRGVPWVAPVMALLKDMKDFRETELISNQVAACYSVFIKTLIDPDDAAEGAATDVAADGKRLEEIEPGRVNYLLDGEDIAFASPGRIQGAFAPYMEWNLRAVAAGLNYPYEMLAKDWKGTTYSAGRLALIDGRMAFRGRQQSVSDTLLVRIWRRFVTEFFIVYSDEIKAQGINLRAWELNAWVFEAHMWIAPGWPWIDPTKEVDASATAIDEDLSSLTDELAQRGIELDELMESRLREKILKLEQFAKLKERAGDLGLTDAEMALALGRPASAAAAVTNGQPTDAEAVAA